MKALLAALAMFGWLVFAAPNVRAQVYPPYYGPYADPRYQHYLGYQHHLEWQRYLEYLRLNDPYYDLHAMHYQLYLQPYQPYPTYTPCCYGFALPWSQNREFNESKSRAPKSVPRK